ncbi:hypothetical protein L226DRAFT_312432 [Lentinus tigrinus ALCF2SS1-7]|uniref:F-box domain-containing protein n=1 Tax=Lentinus tigrinus ALCF2SS1-6 TaxID=1328759 RepID=A0A5C2RSH8_9APHY|nr:hypothetical protein L227DRAFT_657800 [Lentinus tigrinus ALCF2SS1-6]RPD68876.1 hypothetical protein L226DRAFT_312432 [Lentinus tigrinus ALCF2SS1-7]
MDTLPVLSYDILHLVMSLSSTREVCRMMETCKLLCGEGAKFLLHNVELKDDRDIQSFTQFMATDPHRRIRYLHTLDFKCGRLSSETGVLLRVFLVFASPFLGLRYLMLAKPEELLRSDRGLIEAFSRIPASPH